MFNIPLPVLFSRIVVLMVAFTIHELAHAWTADYFGDDTPRSQGRITLNPMAHLDPIGTLLLLVAGFGWARPVMVDPYRLGPRNFMLTALAGPASNFVMALVAGLLVGIIGLAPSIPSTDATFPTAFPIPASAKSVVLPAKTPEQHPSRSCPALPDSLRIYHIPLQNSTKSSFYCLASGQSCQL